MDVPFTWQSPFISDEVPKLRCDLNQHSIWNGVEFSNPCVNGPSLLALCCLYPGQVSTYFYLTVTELSSLSWISEENCLLITICEHNSS